MKTYRLIPRLSQAASPRPSRLTIAISLVLGLTLAGCANISTRTSSGTADAGKSAPPYRGGGYYKDDGPGANPPANLHAIPDAVPKAEPFNQYASRSYKVLGKRYVPLADNADYKARGLASWYGRKFHGNATSIGEPYDMYAMSAAHPTLPLPSYARVTNLENGKSVVVRLNDRGPFHPGRIIDLSYTAAYKLDILKGVTPVEVESVHADAAPSSFAALAQEDLTPDLPTPTSKIEPAQLNPGKAVYLQLGAFANPATADILMAQATAQLSSAFPGVMRLEMNGLFKVQAGPFATEAAADQAAAAVHRDFGIKSFKVIEASLPTAPVQVPELVTTPLIAVAINETRAETAAETRIAESAVAEPNVEPGLYLQLAALSSPAAAEALALRVKNRFGDELPGLNQINSGNLVKLHAGPFTTPAAAEQVAVAYFQDFGVRPYRVKR